MNRYPIIRFLLAATAIACPAGAQHAERIPVTELKPLLRIAIEKGVAKGFLTGPSAAYMQQKFGTTAPLEIDVHALHPLPQPGCSRLAVTSRQRNVLEKGKHEDRELTYQLNYCQEGGFPKGKRPS